jgi:hypothetical protein
LTSLAEALRGRLAQACTAKRLVVWYDPGATLADLAASAVPEGAQLLQHEGSFLETRARFEEADPRLEGNWLIYVPETRPQPSWLRDLELAGTSLELDLGGLVSRAFGLATSVRLKSLLQGPLGRVVAARWEELVGVTAPSAAELKRALLAAALDLGADAHLRDIVTEYLGAPDAPRRLSAAGLQQELKELLEAEGGLSGLPAGDVPGSLLAAAVLLSEAVEHGGLDPSPFTQVLPAPARRAQWASWAKAWSQRGDDSSFERWSGEVERLYGLHEHLAGEAASRPRDVARITSFAGVDDVLLEEAVELLVAGDLEALREVALMRRETRWARSAEKRGEPLPWSVVVPALELLQGAEQARKELSSKGSWALEEILGRYAGDDGWWQLDDTYRRLDASWAKLSHQLEKRLAIPAARAYGSFLDLLGAEVCRSLEGRAQWPAEGWKSQRAVAASVLGGNRAAIVLADALRFDLGHTLAERLRSKGFEVDAVPTLAELPSVTQVGMAAIQSPAWATRQPAVEAGGTWYPRVGGKVLRSREDRLAQLRTLYPGATGADLADVAHRRLDPRSGPLVVFASAIDEQGDALPQVGVDVLEKLTWAISDAVEKLLGAGFLSVAVIADHGFVLAPQGYELHRTEAPSAGAGTARSWRYMVGHPPSSEGTLRVPAAALGWQGEAAVAFPRGLAVFSLPGEAPRFFHGGPLPQEAAVLSLICRQREANAPPVTVRLTGPDYIGTVLPSFILEGEADQLLSRPRRARVVVRFEGRVVGESEPVEVGAGEVQAARVRLQRYGKEVEVAVEDVGTREVLVSRAVRVELPMGYEDLPL